MTENQAPVEKDVDHCHQQGRVSDDLGVADTYVKRAEQEVEHHEDDAELPESEILYGGGIDAVRLNDVAHQSIAEKEQNTE